MKKELVILALILLGGFIVRLYKFNAPVADWQSWRQVDTSAVSRNFVKDGFDVLHPRFDDLSNVQSGIYDNPEGYRFVEFPIYNVLQAGGFLIFDKFNIEEWGRLISIFASLSSIIFLYILVKRYSNKTIGLFSAFFLSFLPFNIFWGRTILPDSLVTTATLLGILFFDLWVESFNRKSLKKILYFLLSSIFLSLALLLKPFAIFFFLPVAWLAFKKWGLATVKRRDIILLTFISVVPFLIWRLWSIQFPGGVPQSGWLFNSGNIRFKGAFFYWIFAKRIGELILGFWGLPILVMGIILRRKNSFFLSFLLSSLLYIFVVARGNVQHDYYQIPIIPTIAIFLALGSEFFLNPPKQYFLKIITYPVFIFSILLMFSLSFKNVRDYYNIQDSSILVAGAAVDRLTPKGAKVVAPYEGDTTLLYYTKRKGWASFSKPLPKLIKMGASYLVLVNPKKQDFDIGKSYKIISFSPQFILFDLHQKP